MTEKPLDPPVARIYWWPKAKRKDKHMNTNDEQAIIAGLYAFARMLSGEIAAALETSPRVN